MKIERIHHVAYRCRDAEETVLWYRKMLGMDFVLSLSSVKPKRYSSVASIVMDGSSILGHACRRLEKAHSVAFGIKKARI